MTRNKNKKNNQPKARFDSARRAGPPRAGKIKICYFGAYEPNHTRNKVYISGLKQNGVKVIECCDNSRRLIKFYKLFIKHWKIRNNYDVMIVGYPGPLIAPFARLISRKPVIFNAMTSLYEVSIVSRGIYSKNSFMAWYIWLIDWLSFKSANLVLVETNKQKEYIVKKLELGIKNSLSYLLAQMTLFFIQILILKKTINSLFYLEVNFYQKQA